MGEMVKMKFTLTEIENMSYPEYYYINSIVEQKFSEMVKAQEELTNSMDGASPKRPPPRMT